MSNDTPEATMKNNAVIEQKGNVEQICRVIKENAFIGQFHASRDRVIVDLKALAESWQQQNAMLEAAEGIAFGDSNHNYITLCGEDDRWRSVDEMATVQYGGGPVKYTHPGYGSVLEAYNALTKGENR